MSKTFSVERVDPADPARGPIEAAARIITGGGLVVFPTRCLYGLGADARNDAAVADVLALKRRSPANPIAVLIPGIQWVARLARRVPTVARILMEGFWPGRLTLVFEAVSDLPHGLTAGQGKIGVRLPGHPVARALLEAVARPITATSANISGAGGHARVDAIELSLRRAVGLIVDAGILAGGPGSTVVDVSSGRPRLLREGCVTKAELGDVAGKAYKFID